MSLSRIFSRLALAALAGLPIMAGCGASSSSSGPEPLQGVVAATIPGTNEVVKADLLRAAVTARRTVLAPGFIAQDPARARLYVGSASRTLYTLDSRTLAIVREDRIDGLRDIAVAPDGSRLYLLAVRSGVAQLLVADTVSYTLQGVIECAGTASRTTEARGSLLAVSPDGSRVAVLAPAAVHVIDAATLERRQIALSSSFLPEEGIFLDDSRTFLAGGTDRDRLDGRIVAVDTNPGEVRWTIDGGTNSYTALAAPAGAGLAYVTGVFFGLSGVTTVDFGTRSLGAPVPDDRERLPSDLALVGGGRAVVAASNWQDAEGGRLFVLDPTTLGEIASVKLSAAAGRVVESR